MLRCIVLIAAFLLNYDQAVFGGKYMGTTSTILSSVVDAYRGQGLSLLLMLSVIAIIYYVLESKAE